MKYLFGILTIFIILGCCAPRNIVEAGAQPSATLKIIICNDGICVERFENSEAICYRASGGGFQCKWKEIPIQIKPKINFIERVTTDLCDDGYMEFYDWNPSQNNYEDCECRAIDKYKDNWPYDPPLINEGRICKCDCDEWIRKAANHRIIR